MVVDGAVGGSIGFIPVDGSWQHPDVPNSLGMYFKYDINKWKEYFGTATSGSLVQVKQCRSGAEVWNGEVIIWPAENNRPPHGRRNNGASQGQWEKDDYVIKVSVFDV